MDSANQSPLKKTFSPSSWFLNHRDYFWLLLLLLLLDAGMWNLRLWPNLDGASAEQIFFSFYNEFFFHHHLVLWLPYGSYGIPAAVYQIQDLSPANYLTGFIGALAGIPNAFWLFRLSLFLEQVMLLVGTYLLAQELYESRWARFLLCLSVVGGTIWMLHYEWNFRIYSSVPLYLFFLFRFYRKHNPSDLWLSGLVTLSSMIGIAPYVAFFHLTLQLVINAAHLDIFWKHRRAFLEKSFKNIGFFALMLTAAIVYFHLTSSMMRGGVSHFQEGRDPVTKQVSLKDFLTHDSFDMRPAKLLGFLAPHLPVEGMDQSGLGISYYAGLVPLVFLGYALLRARDRRFYTLTLAGLFWTLFSMGDAAPVAKTLYGLFPPIRYMRHIGALGAIIRLFLLIAAAFGVDHFLKDLAGTPQQGRPGAKNLLLGTGILVAAGTLTAQLLNRQGQLFPNPWPSFAWFSGAMLGLWLFFVVSRKNTGGPRIAVFAMLILFFDLLGYRYMILHSWPHRFQGPASELQEATTVHDYSFQDRRILWGEGIDALFDSRFHAARLYGLAANLRLGSEYLGYQQFDPCFTQLWIQYHWAAGFEDLVQTRWSFFRGMPDSDKIPELMNVLGCSEPKLRFLHAVIPAGSTEQARVLTREIPDLSAAAIIETPDAAASAGIRKGSPGHLRVTSFNFNELQLEAEVPESGEGWLYYADAYHPGWHAEINRHPAPVLKANLGFKALRLSPGSQQVKMRFFDGSLSSACYLTALWGLGFAAWVLGMAVKLASGKGL